VWRVGVRRWMVRNRGETAKEGKVSGEVHFMMRERIARDEEKKRKKSPWKKDHNNNTEDLNIMLTIIM
jgi:hypothetical protein